MRKIFLSFKNIQEKIRLNSRVTIEEILSYQIGNKISRIIEEVNLAYMQDGYEE